MSVDLSTTYTIVAPALTDGRGGTAVLNNTASADFVGYLFDSSGFESPEIRESSDPITEGDGAVFGSFFYGPRPFTMDVLVEIAASDALSHTRLDKLFRATNAMRSDGTITWTETGGQAKLMNFRRQQPIRGPSIERHCLFAGVSADPRIVSATETSTPMNATINNLGNAPYPPRFTLSAPSNPVITNTDTGEVLSLTLSGGGLLTVDFKNRTVTQGGVSRYSSVNFTTSTWWELRPGSNAVTVSGGGTNTMLWRSAWI